MVAHGRQSCLADEGVIHIAHCLVITCHHSSMRMAKIAVLLIPPPLLGKCCAFQEKWWEIISPLLSEERSLQALCPSASLAHGPVGTGDLCIGWSGVWLAAREAKSICTAALKLKHRCEFVWEAKLPFWVVAPGYWLVSASLCVHWEDKGKRVG